MLPAFALVAGTVTKPHRRNRTLGRLCFVQIVAKTDTDTFFWIICANGISQTSRFQLMGDSSCALASFNPCAGC
jgi:hypothetical protein